MNQLKLRNRVVDYENPCFIIGEIGINHNGSIDTAKELIKIATKAGVDAVKFQTFRAENLLSNEILIPDNVTSLASYIEVVKKQELPYDAYPELISTAKSHGLYFISSPFDFESVDMLQDIGVDAIKIASHNINNLPLILKIVATNLPIILSTGMSSFNEVAYAISVASKNIKPNLALLHCTSSYPPTKEDLNLRAIKTLQLFFPYPIGYSDHSIGIDVAVASVMCGAKLLEKHITMGRDAEGPDHLISATPEELCQLVERIRDFEIIYGDGIKKVRNCEHKMIKSMRLSITAAKNIQSGEELTENNITIKRPATGISPADYYMILGRVVKKFISKNDVIRYDDLI